MQGLRADNSLSVATFRNEILVMRHDVLLVLRVTCAAGVACALASVCAFLPKVQRQFIVVEVRVRVVVVVVVDVLLTCGVAAVLLYSFERMPKLGPLLSIHDELHSCCGRCLAL